MVYDLVVLSRGCGQELQAADPARSVGILSAGPGSYKGRSWTFFVAFGTVAHLERAVDGSDGSDGLSAPRDVSSISLDAVPMRCLLLHDVFRESMIRTVGWQEQKRKRHRNGRSERSGDGRSDRSA